jgi:hypothetical protein
VRLQSARKSAIQATRTQYIVLTCVAFLVMAVIALRFPLTATAATSTGNIYIAQTAGTFTGGTACNGQTAVTPSSVTWTAGNTYYICGTITGTNGASVLTVGASGTSSNLITILFDTGAILQAGYCNDAGCLNLNGQQYIVVNGQHTGTIQATTNGTSGYSGCINGSCSTQQVSNGVANFGSNDTTENLTIQDMYVNNSDEVGTALNQVNCVELYQLSVSNVTISGNTIHDCATGVEFWWNGSGNSNYTVSNNSISRNCWGMDIVQSGSGTTYNNTYIFGNKFYDRSNWAAANASCHANGMHLFQANGCSTCVNNGMYIYNNEWDGPNNAVDTTVGAIQIDNNGGQSNVTNGWIFNNVFSFAPGDCASTCNALLGVWNGSGWSLYNNTFIGNTTSTASQNGGSDGLVSSIASLNFKNNVMTTSNSLIQITPGLPLSGSPDYNIYADGGSGGATFYCGNGSGSGNKTSSFASWVSCIGNETHSAYYSTPPLPNCNSNTDCSNVQPASGSTVIGAGENLNTICNGQPNPGVGALCFDKAGNARPSSGAWDVGAYSSGSSVVQPTPPSSLTATVSGN